jgi:trimeric autotransporter adhesin
MSDPTLSTPPETPVRGSATFSSQVASFLAWMSGFSGQVNTVVPWMRSRITDASNSATAAATAQAGAVAARAGSEAARDDALAVSDAPFWTAKTYVLRDAVISPLTFRTYRDSTGGSSTVDPSLDPVRWKAIEFDSLAAIALSKGITMVDACIDVSPNPPLSVQMRTSWYSEPLNTATRGARRELPTNKVVIAEASRVTIFDADDPALPMWMVFSRPGVVSGSTYFRSLDMSSINMVNGVLAIGLRNSADGVIIADFAGDKAVKLRSADATGSALSTHQEYTGGLVERSLQMPQFFSSGKMAIVNSVVNVVAMTVLPDAPIDPVSGLQVPTIAVGTDGGVSIIDGPAGVGKIVDITHVSSNVCTFVELGEDGSIRYVADSNASLRRYLHIDFQIPIADVSKTNVSNNGLQSDAFFHRQDSPNLSGVSGRLLVSNIGLQTGDTFGGPTGATFLNFSKAEPNKSLLAYITSKYNTGWMSGGCLGALLCSTDTASLVGSGELVANGTFNTDLTGFSQLNADTNNYWEVVGGKARCVSDGGFVPLLTEPILTVGKQYYMEFDVTAATGTLKVGTDSSAINISSALPVGRNRFYFTAATARLYFSRQLGVTDATIDNLTVREVQDSDRSAKNKGLIVNGTITRTPVATGAELVWYGGFSDTGYLEQPYNPDLDFGTGDFTIEAWIKGAASLSTTSILSRMSTLSKGIHFYKLSTSSGGKLAIRLAGATYFATGGGIADDAAHHVVVRREGSLVTLWQDGLIVGSTSNSADINDVGELTTIGHSLTQPTGVFLTGIAQVKPYNRALSDDEIRFIYEKERPMFNPGAQVTLGGTSDAVTALAHDAVTGLVHVGKSDGMSDFSGLIRVRRDTDPVTTKIAAHGGLIVRQ